MKDFIISIVFVVFCFVIIAFPVEYFLTCRQNNYTYKYDYVNKHKDDIKTMLIGNSYFENSINPHFLGDSVFDFAVSGRWIYYDMMLMRRFVPQMKSLKTLIFPLGYRMPFEISYHYKPLRLLDKYYVYWYSHAMNVDYDKLPAKYCYQSAIIVGNSSLMHPDSIYCDSIGYQKFVGQSLKWQEDQNIIPNLMYQKNAENIFVEYKQYLTEIAKVCSENNVRFIVIIPPCHDCFVQNANDEGLEKIHDMLKEISAMYSIEYKDYFKDIDFRADSIYCNSSHLNSIGADMLAKRVKADFSL